MQKPAPGTLGPSRGDSLPGGGPVPLARGPKVKMALSTQNVWWRNSSTPGTFSGLFPRVRAYADPKPLPQAGGVRHRYTRTPPPRHSPGWLGGTLRAGPGPLIDPHGAHGGPGPTPPIPPLGHPTRHPALVIWLRKRRLAGHPKNVLKNAAPRFDPPGSLILLCESKPCGGGELLGNTLEKDKIVILWSIFWSILGNSGL